MPGSRSRRTRGRAPDGPISLQRFHEIVAEEMDALPESIHLHLDNVAVVVEDEPDRETLLELGLDPDEDSLYGFYDGTPIVERGDSFGFALPDRIVIYYRPLTEDFGDEYHVRREIRKTVVHEVGHFFGLSDREIERMGY
jgi:predicted Zn-dependent protease with MMP-like domain